jgi:EAL domain-containing protein (putative c-di-GMP-specific phosphodiesterase class I)
LTAIPNGPIAVRRRLIARRFDRAAATGDLQLHYQPIVSLKDGSIAAAEALIRWRTAGGWLPPSAFLPYMRGTRESARLHSFVIDAATAQARAWQERGQSIQVTVNVSPRAVDTALARQITVALRDTGLDPQLLHVELTEIDDGPWTGELAASLHRLRDLGVTISIDDFGQGESSLARLVSLPLDVLKIDRGFIAAMEHDRRSAGAVKNATDLAHSLAMSAVGEGVETPEQWHSLREWGCDYAQGFLISRPLPADQLMPALLSNVIPMLDRLSRAPGGIERRIGPDDRRHLGDRRRRGPDLWPHPVERRARR